MPNLNVQVVGTDDEPIEDAKVFVLIHAIMPDTWLEEYTDEDGHADFDISDFVTVDVYVNGTLEEEGISLGDSDEAITISI